MLLEMRLRVVLNLLSIYEYINRTTKHSNSSSQLGSILGERIRERFKNKNAIWKLKGENNDNKED